MKRTAGFISPPDYDEDGYYDFNVLCHWHIQVNDNASIIYQFLYIDIEETVMGCDTDYLQVSPFSLPKHANTVYRFFLNC